MLDPEIPDPPRDLGPWPTPDLESVRVLSLKPGDALVLKVDDRRLNTDRAKQYSEQIAALFPGHDIIVLGFGAELDVVEREPSQYRVRLRGGPYAGQTQLTRELNIIEHFASRAVPISYPQWTEHLPYRRTLDLEDGMIVYEYLDETLDETTDDHEAERDRPSGRAGGTRGVGSDREFGPD